MPCTNASGGAIREVPNAVLRELADVYDRIHIRSLDGLWRSRSYVVLPGRIVGPGDEGVSSNSHLLVDMDFHDCENDSRVFQAMGVSDLPRSDWTRYQAESWVNYTNEMCAVYWRHLTDDQNPRQDSIGVIGRCQVPVALKVAHRSTGLVKARVYSQFLDPQLLSRCQPVTIGHTGSNISRDRYPKVSGPHPFVWDIIQFGDIKFDNHLVPVGLVLVHFDALRRIGNHPFRSLDKELEILRELIPDGYPIMKSASLKRDESVDHFSVLHMHANSLQNYRMNDDRHWEGSGFWAAVESFCLLPTTGPETAGLIYEWMCESSRFPQVVCSASGIVSFQGCYVTSSSEMSAIAARANWPVVFLASATAQRWSKAGARALEESVKLEVGPDTKSSALLLDVAPEFRSVLKESAVGLARVRFVEHIRLSVEGGADYQALTWNSDQGTVLVDHASFTGLGWQGQVEALFAAARRAGWVSGDLTKARQRTLQEIRAIRLRREVAEGSDLAERVFRLADCDAHRLLESFEDEERVAIPAAWMDDGLSLARLALRVYGPGVLHQLRELLVDRGLAPPSHWGTREAREFVSSLGFPPEFASAPRGRRASEVSVSGPMPLGPLHEFQKEIINDLRPILENKGMTGRGVISLPTGAGKTRVAVEASVRHVLRSDSVTGSVLWVAQTDELCEQAVQSFRQVWSSAGLEWTDLRIVRLWGGNPDPTPSPDGTPTVIVSSIQTLNSRLERLSLLDACALVMLDECHHAIAPSYTRLLNRLAPADGPPKSEAGPPVIGLTATPFRGRRSDEETRWLANRFAQRMFPRADRQPHLYSEFRDDGILSEHHFEPLHFDQPFDFTRAEREYISTYNELPASALNRLAGYTDRNHLIVQRTIQAAEDGPVLLFSNSVAHARYLSTRLCVNGVEAASIYSETETAVRQYFIRRFQDGDVKVLTNYQVLSTGFDAPKVSTIVISRPVFTPSRYIQMVGRGLRGPKHGGTSECKIITVVDNLMEYQNRLAYHYFMDHYT